MHPTRIPRDIFRAYDIRGRALGESVQLTPDLTYRIARAYAHYLHPTRRAVVGGDQRTSTPALMQAAIEGLLDGGVDVIQLGRAPSPLVYWASAARNLERPTGGIVVTASHNPPVDNGVKLLEPGGMPLRPEAIQQVADVIESGSATRLPRGSCSAWNPTPDYVDSLAAVHSLDRPLSIAVDPGNGVAALTASHALSAIGSEVAAINDDPDEPIQAHPADPQHADNMVQIGEFVTESNADLGFAFDGDGDRLGLVDARGHRAAPDQVLALLAQEWLTRHPGAEIHVDVKTSQAVVEHISQLGGRAVFGPVGHSLGKYAMQERGIDFGGEASTHYFYRVENPPHITDDAVRTACRIAQIASQAALEPILDAMPRYPISPEVKIACPDDRKHTVSTDIARAAAQRWPVDETDGARIDLSCHSAGAWCLIRASNTTPYLTVIVEARSEAAYETARQLTTELLADQGLEPGPLISQPPLD